MSRLRWGVLSTARIATEKVIPGIQKSELNVVTAIASRDGARAQAAAAQLGIARALDSYEDLLADPDIDVIYNPLPNHLHVPLTLSALEAGKHVLCEKPIALDADEARELLDRPGPPYVMEAFMVRFHPQWLRAREIVRSGELGAIQRIAADFSYSLTDPANIRQDPKMGGGGLLDIGGYCMLAGRFLFEAEPRRVFGLFDRDPGFGIDRHVTGLADFGAGRQLGFTISTQSVRHQRVSVFGADGYLEIICPFNAAPDSDVELRIGRGELDGSDVRIETIPAADQYALQADGFARAIMNRTPPPYGPDDAVKNMQILTALFRSEQSGQWETVTDA
ncbi:Gfo/Idh/MocA family protein [Cucumibacter marinus]|uniref:Gfo/Idh/MocA family protein n=1 Tax=Cucumibacter marinus TaxID=1121252 RepID=UPI000415AC62|nr:Gfo/Idh/MocA family oxidoreductase [Cucumibacter marinus]